MRVLTMPIYFLHQKLDSLLKPKLEHVTLLLEILQWLPIPLPIRSKDPICRSQTDLIFFLFFLLLAPHHSHPLLFLKHAKCNPASGPLYFLLSLKTLCPRSMHTSLLRLILVSIQSYIFNEASPSSTALITS